MQILKARKEHLPQIKALWIDVFDDGTEGFCNFIFSITNPKDIYIIIENDEVVSMLIAVTDIEYKEKKGFYLYSACTAKKYRNKGYMHELIEFAINDQKKQGKVFCVLQPASESLFDFYKKLGFDNVSELRKCNVDIKKNIWQTAEFDIMTASRFSSVRKKHYKENMIQYTSKSWEKFAEYLYTFGGSTAETENAYAVYYVDKGVLKIIELLADSSFYAMNLLQAISDKTGCEKAEIYLPRDSDLFIGEGKKQNRYAIRGLSECVYINLMFE